MVDKERRKVKLEIHKMGMRSRNNALIFSLVTRDRVEKGVAAVLGFEEKRERKTKKMQREKRGKYEK